MGGHTTFDEIINLMVEPPGLYIVLAVAVGVMAWKYAQRKTVEQDPPRELLAQHTTNDVKGLLKALGTKPRKTGIYKGITQIGEVLKILELPASKISKSKGKEMENHESQEKVIIAKYHKPGLMNKIFGHLGMYHIMILSSGALHNFDKDNIDIEDKELVDEVQSSALLLKGTKYRNLYIKDNISIQHHAGVVLVSTKEAKDYVKNIVWKISHENATGQYVEFTKQLPYLNAMFSAQIEQMEKLQELEDKSFKDKIKGMS